MQPQQHYIFKLMVNIVGENSSYKKQCLIELLQLNLENCCTWTCHAYTQNEQTKTQTYTMPTSNAYINIVLLVLCQNHAYPQKQLKNWQPH